MESKDLLDLCRQHGMDVKNQLSSLDPEQCDQIEALVKRGSKGGVAVAPPPPAPLPTNLDTKVRNLSSVRRPAAAPTEAPPPPAPATSTPPAPPAPAAPSAPPAAPAAPAAAAPAAPAPAPVVSPPAPSVPPTPAVESQPIAPPPAPVVAPPSAAATPAPAAPPSPSPAPAAAQVRPAETPPAARPATPAPPVPAAPVAEVRVPPVSTGKVPTLSTARPTDAGRQRAPRQIRPPVARPPMIATPPPLRPLKPKPQEKVQQKVQQPIARMPEALKPLKPQDIKEVVSRLTVAPVAPPPEIVEDEDEGDPKKAKQRPGMIPGREQRHQKRSQRQQARKDRAEAEVRNTGRLVVELDEDEEERQRRRRRDALIRRQQPAGPKPRKGKVPIDLPITVRSLSEATGAKVGDLLFRLRDHGAPATININSTIDPLVAEVVAHDLGCELDIKKGVDIEAQILASRQAPDKPEDLVPRPPIVTIMGHVDHGKTTLLDKIRQSNIVATEAGGITQVIRAWRVEHGGKWITFLDTPGHEAFTKMRARGANVTDIAVIVVAADDGVMPQTEEAISHAKAAGVSMVVCINKVDLPNANVNRTRQQLYGLSLLPDNMGGDVPFVETSAAKGQGINDLLEAITLVADYQIADKLKANPNKPATGTCLEAMLTEGEGVVATLLVRDGTLHKGDVVLCGASAGRVRAMYNDLNKPIDEAGPSVPVRITGLDEVPNADDPFHVVDDLALSREAAEQRKTRRVEGALAPRPTINALEQLAQAKIPELKIILKADFRGSIEAIKKELEKLSHAEVRVNVLHTGIGAITESDVNLALTSPEDTIIVGFNVVPDDRAHALAEERGVQIRQYDIIYNLTDDIKQALEGKLKPHEQVVHLGRAVVRKTFKIGRVGTIAGCYVTQGVIERSAKVRLIRQGVVIYPPADRTVGLESLKRFKDDVRDVREGFECGLKIAGYDDVKVDDVIEAYRVEQVQRSLEGEKK
jgi:translation initiation factor IF-2